MDTYADARRGGATGVADVRDSRPTILHVITDLGTGGAEATLARLVRLDGPFRHVVVSLMAGGMWRGYLSAAGIEVADLGMRRGVPSPIGLWRLARLIRNYRPALVQTWLYHGDLLGFLATRMAGRIPIVWNLRCSDMDFRRYSRITSLVVRALSWLSPFTAAIVVNSEAGRRWHIKLGYRPPKWELLPNGIDVMEFRPSIEARQRWRKKLGLSEDSILIGMAARRDPMKDHEGLLTAASLLPENICFAMVGDGVTATDPSLACERRGIHLLGRCNDMPGFFSALDIAVLASNFGEGFPNVVAEAMACGVPCIVTDVGDSAEIVAETGLIVPPRDPVRLAAAMQTMAEQASTRSHLGKLARERISTRYALPIVSARYENFWTEIIASRSKFLRVETKWSRFRERAKRCFGLWAK